MSAVEALCDVLFGVCAGTLLIPFVLMWARWRTDTSAEGECARLARERRLFAHAALAIDLAAAQRARPAQQHARVEALDSRMRAVASGASSELVRIMNAMVAGQKQLGYVWPEPMRDELLGFRK